MLTTGVSCQLSCRRGVRLPSRTTPRPETGQGDEGNRLHGKGSADGRWSPRSIPRPSMPRSGVRDGSDSLWRRYSTRAPRHNWRASCPVRERGPRQQGHAPWTGEEVTPPLFDLRCDLIRDRARVYRLRDGMEPPRAPPKPRAAPIAASGAMREERSSPLRQTAPHDRSPGPPPPARRRDVRTRTPSRYRTRTRGRPCRPVGLAPSCR